MNKFAVLYIIGAKKLIINKKKYLFYTFFYTFIGYRLDANTSQNKLTIDLLT